VANYNYLKKDGLEIHDIYNGKKYSWQFLRKNCYHLKSWIIIIHGGCVVLMYFFKWKKIVKTCIIIISLWVLLNSLYLLNSFQFFSHVTIYLKHFHVNTLQTYNLSINFETKIEKSSIHYNIMCPCTTNDSLDFEWIHWS
jgi:hypothetical protein